MSSLGHYHSLVRRVNDVLLKILNICTDEELAEYDEHIDTLIERNQIVNNEKNKFVRKCVQ